MVRIVGSVCCALLALAGCGGGDATVADTNPDTTAATATTSTSSGSSVVALDLAACDLVTSDEVAAATELIVAAVTDDPPISCVFDLDGSADIFVAVEDGQGRMAGAASLFDGYMERVGDGGAEIIPDLGAAAVYSQSFRALAVDAGGGRFFAVGVSGGYGNLAEPRDALIALAGAALGRL